MEGILEKILIKTEKDPFEKAFGGRMAPILKGPAETIPRERREKDAKRFK